jgi:hypothetical protein
VVVTPGTAGSPPSDAVVLFDGKDLSAWKSDSIWIVLPIGIAETLRELVIRQAIAFRAWIVFTELGNHLDRVTSESRKNDLCCLTGSWIGTADHDVRNELAVTEPPIAQAFCLQTSEVR